MAAELEWILLSAVRDDFRGDHPVLDEFYARRPDLAERVRGLWPPDVATACGGFEELLILANHGGVLRSDDGDGLVAGLDELCRHAPVAPTLASESEEDRVALHRRLDRLRTDRVFRRRYVALVDEVWAEVGPVWRRRGRPEVDRAVTDRRLAIVQGATLVEVASWLPPALGALLPALAGELEPDAAVVVVPSWFAHRGLVVAVPGNLIVGVRCDLSGQAARQRVERLAGRLKALADPTRFAILQALGERPRTVGALATTFGLAQPTVSNHVRVLRDAGLVLTGADGPARLLSLDRRQVGELLDEAGGLLHVG